jgi:hypothetical protein
MGWGPPTTKPAVIIERDAPIVHYSILGPPGRSAMRCCPTESVTAERGDVILGLGLHQDRRAPTPLYWELPTPSPLRRDLRQLPAPRVDRPDDRPNA